MRPRDWQYGEFGAVISANYSLTEIYDLENLVSDIEYGNEMARREPVKPYFPYDQEKDSDGFDFPNPPEWLQ